MRAGAGAYRRVAVGGAYGVVESGIAAGRKDVCARSIIRNSFGYIAISIVLKRKRLLICNLICNSQKMAKT